MIDGDLGWDLALKAAALLAIDPKGLGGAVLRGSAGPARDAWLEAVRDGLPDVPIRKVPPAVGEGQLIGGLDLAATLAAGRPVAERGLLAAAAGGVLIVPMAERLAAEAVGPMMAALDTGTVVVERDGLASRMPADFAAILFDESVGDECAPASLVERLAFSVDLHDLRPDKNRLDIVAVGRARARAPFVVAAADAIEAICIAGMAFGVPSMRITTFALRAAKAAAALDGRAAVSSADVELAAAMVIAPRATRLPSREEASDEAQPDDAASMSEDDAGAAETAAGNRDGADDREISNDTTMGNAPTALSKEAMADRVIEATRAAIPAGLLADLSLATTGTAKPTGGSRSGPARQSARRGRPAGDRRGSPERGLRLAIVATLRAAAPWQTIRRKAASAPPDRILVRREDFRVGRFKRKQEAATIFVVDASGSAALHRLGEVKGAVELILAECYVRRDSVALIAFRGTSAELLLAPTRSLARAKRALAGQPGGGGTPLAAGIEAAAALADGIRRKGQAPLAVFLTDGRGNVGRDGRPGRRQGEADAMAAAGMFRVMRCASLVLDVAPRPGEPARRLADALGARYVALPYADASSLSRAVLDR